MRLLHVRLARRADETNETVAMADRDVVVTEPVDLANEKKAKEKQKRKLAKESLNGASTVVVKRKSEPNAAKLRELSELLLLLLRVFRN